MGQITKLKGLANQRVMSILLLGFASGLPIALTISTLQAWYTETGVKLMTIGLLSLVGLPYTFKFLWAPFFDRFTPKWFGRRRGWIVLMQAGLAFSLAGMAILSPAKTPGLLAFAALMVAAFSASQDIAIDAYRTDLLHVEERGMGAAMNTVGYRLAILTSGALALILAAKLGFRVTYFIMAGLMAAEIFITIWAPAPQEMRAPVSMAKAITEPLKEFFNRKNAVLLLIFIVIYKLCDAFALSLNTTFLLRGVGFSLIDVGTISKIVGMGAALLGSIVGGAWMFRLGLYKSLMYFGVAQILSNLTFAWLAIVGKSYTVMAITIFVENFAGGLSTVAFVAFLMSLCDKRFTATQYAVFSALSAVGRVFVGPEAALMVNYMGWVQFYIWTAVIGIPSLMVLWWLRNRVVFNASTLTQPG